MAQLLRALIPNTRVCTKKNTTSCRLQLDCHAICCCVLHSGCLSKRQIKKSYQEAIANPIETCRTTAGPLPSTHSKKTNSATVSWQVSGVCCNYPAGPRSCEPKQYYSTIMHSSAQITKLNHSYKRPYAYKANPLDGYRPSNGCHSQQQAPAHSKQLQNSNSETCLRNVLY